MKDTEYLLIVFDADKPKDEDNTKRKKIDRETFDRIKNADNKSIHLDEVRYVITERRFIGFGSKEKGFLYMAIIDVKLYEGPAKSNIQ